MGARAVVARRTPGSTSPDEYIFRALVRDADEPATYLPWGAVL